MRYKVWNKKSKKYVDNIIVSQNGNLYINHGNHIKDIQNPEQYQIELCFFKDLDDALTFKSYDIIEADKECYILQDESSIINVSENKEDFINNLI